MEEFLIVTFESTNFAMQGESVLKSENIRHQIIPTPREITLSCGLSIKTEYSNIDTINSLVSIGKIRVKRLYKMSGSGSSRSITEAGR